MSVRRSVLVVSCAGVALALAAQGVAAAGRSDVDEQHDYRLQRAKGYSQEEIDRQESMTGWTDVSTLHIVERHEEHFTSR